MKIKFDSRTITILAAAGVALAVATVAALNQPQTAQKPAFNPAANPYAHAIYATGIIESAQSNGENVNLNPEVEGRVSEVYVQEGASVKAGQALFMIDDSVQHATADQQTLQAQASLAQLNELKAEPRRETLAVAQAQVDAASANLKTLVDQRDKLRRSAKLDPRSVSLTALDTAEDGAKAADAALSVANRQLELVRAGAWSYDIVNQQRQYAALTRAADASHALLAKYVVRAPSDGVVLALNVAKGGYVSPQGVYDTYTQVNTPVAVLAAAGGVLQVRCYVDEILLSRLPQHGDIRAQMSVRGADVHIPLRFVRVQPYVSPKIELSDERQERVDLRVLPVIFQFQANPKLKLFPGQLVDVYISER
jgi:HlyD family secretion protein